MSLDFNPRRVPNRLLAFGCAAGRDAMDMGSLRAELQLPHHFITGEDDHDLDEDIMMLGSTPQVTSPTPSLVVGQAISNDW